MIAGRGLARRASSSQGVRLALSCPFQGYPAVATGLVAEGFALLLSSALERRFVRLTVVL